MLILSPAVCMSRTQDQQIGCLCWSRDLSFFFPDSSGQKCENQRFLFNLLILKEISLVESLTYFLNKLSCKRGPGEALSIHTEPNGMFSILVKCIDILGPFNRQDKVQSWELSDGELEEGTRDYSCFMLPRGHMANKYTAKVLERGTQLF